MQFIRTSILLIFRLITTKKMSIIFTRLLDKLKIIHLAVFVLFFFAHCANRGTPNGGDIDKIPPVVLESEPSNYSTEFKEDRVTISFDEYIVLKNINAELMISPPMEELPPVYVRGKELIIDLDDVELDSNTTYTFSFNNSIVDLHADNKMPNYEFVFSTGVVLDSLRIGGKLVDAKTLQSVKDVYVMAYKNPVDSMPKTEIPNYISKTDENGKFSINNLSDADYLIFALKDGNMNFMFDLPDEQIGFELQIMRPTATLISRTDTLDNDSVIVVRNIKYSPDSLEIVFFEEDHAIQYITKYQRLNAGKFDFQFNRKFTDSLQFELLEPKLSKASYAIESNKKDSITIWATDTLLFGADTVVFQAQFLTADSTGKLVMTKDTLRLPYNFEEEKMSTKLIISNLSSQKGFWDNNIPFIINSDFPISTIDTSKIELIQKVDTTETPIAFSLARHDSIGRKYHADFVAPENSRFEIRILPGAFSDVYQRSNDSTEFRFSTRPEDYFGKLIVSTQGINQQAVMYLLNDNLKSETILRKYIIKAGKILNINHLPHGKYRLKAFQDGNKNGEWDTGNYDDKLQPEKVYYYKEVIEIRANWDMEIEWDLKKEK